MKKMLIANWKMQLSVEESIALASEIMGHASMTQALTHEPANVVICPSHTALAGVAQALAGSHIALGSQDVFWQEKGAYTGEVSPAVLKELGCAYCIVGHSERRQNMGETNEMVNKKISALIADGIVPVLCVGETKDERDAGKKFAVVQEQLIKGLRGQTELRAPLCVAYEPRWVIGTGSPIAPSDAEEMHTYIWQTLGEIFSLPARDQYARVLYGGAVNADNLAGFLAMSHVGGALVGSASLHADEFVRMIDIVAHA